MNDALMPGVNRGPRVHGAPLVQRVVFVERILQDLLAMIGAFLGWQSIPAVLFIASISGSLGGVAILLGPRGRARARRVLASLGPAALVRHFRRTPLPFGPFLALGAVTALYVPDLALPWTWVSSG